MGSKALVRLAIVLAVVGILALIVKLTGPGTVESVTGRGTDREKVFSEFPEDIARIRIKTADDEVNLVRGAKTWEVAERGNHPAKDKEIIEFVRKVWDLDVQQAPEIGPSQFERLELIDPDKGGSKTATVVSFLNGEGKELESLWLGKMYEQAGSGPPSPFGGSGATDAGRYVKPGGEEVVFLVNETFSSIEPDPAGWLNEDFFKVEKIKSIAIESTPRESEDEKDAWTEADDWKLTRTEATGEFTLADAGPEEELDNTKVSGMKSAFSNPKFDDVVTGDEAKENQPEQTTFTVETFDGFTYTVKASPKDAGGELYLTYEVAGKFEEKRKEGEEESAEEKESLDKAFAENLKAQKEKLAREQAIAGKVFKVRGYVVDTITKKRSELLKEEEKDEAGTPGEIAPGVSNIPGIPPGGLPVPPSPPAEPKSDPSPPADDDGNGNNPPKADGHPGGDDGGKAKSPGPNPAGKADAPTPEGGPGGKGKSKGKGEKAKGGKGGKGGAKKSAEPPTPAAPGKGESEVQDAGAPVDPNPEKPAGNAAGEAPGNAKGAGPKGGDSGGENRLRY